MIKTRFLRTSTLDRLREDVPLNLDRYRKLELFQELLEDTSLSFEVDFEFEEGALKTLLKPNLGKMFEVENCIAVFSALTNLLPYNARDERLWVYLCHTYGMAYAKARWPIPKNDDDAVKHIRTHFFAKVARQIERDNALSRLWWMAYLCNRVDSMSMEDSLPALLHRTDVRAQLIEHPTMSQNVQVFSVLLEKLKYSLDTDEVLFQRPVNRAFMREMNAIGGFKLLDILLPEQLHKVVDEVLETTIAS